ncbi:MAG: hypothetical protein AAFQ28_15195, partial [Pseudomonadota bacterium]
AFCDDIGCAHGTVLSLGLLGEMAHQGGFRKTPSGYCPVTIEARHSGFDRPWRGDPGLELQRFIHGFSDSI